MSIPEQRNIEKLSAARQIIKARMQYELDMCREVWPDPKDEAKFLLRDMDRKKRLRPLSVAEEHLKDKVERFQRGKAESFREPDGGKTAIALLDILDELMARLRTVGILSVELLLQTDLPEEVGFSYEEVGVVMDAVDKISNRTVVNPMNFPFLEDGGRSLPEIGRSRLPELGDGEHKENSE